MLRHAVFITLILFVQVAQILAQPPSTTGYDVLRAVCSDDANGMFVAGHSSTSETNIIAAVVAHLDSSGDVLWTQTLDFPYWDQFDDIASTEGGGCIAAGSCGSTRRGSFDLAIVRFDSNGDTVWTLFPERDVPWENASALAVEDDGSSWIIGSISDPHQEAHDFLLLRVSADGDTLWSASYGDENDQELGYDLQLTDDGGAVLAGSVADRSSYQRNIYVVRVDADGNTVWNSILENDYPSDAHAILALPNGNFAIAGRTFSDSNSEQSDGLLVMINGNGDELWRRSYGGQGDDEFHAIGLKEDGSFLLAGSRYNYSSVKRQGWLVLTDSNGQGILERQTHYGGDGNEEFLDLARRVDNTWIAVGMTSSEPIGSNDYYYIDDLQVEVDGDPTPSLPSTFTLHSWPNPFNSQITIHVELPSGGPFDLRVFDVLGREVTVLANSQYAFAGIHQFSFDARGLASGTYFVRGRSAGSQDQLQRLPLLK